MRSLLVMLVLVVAAAPVRADTQPQPWAVGVSEPQKQKAHQLLEAGNALFLERKYSEALDKYREAIGVWDHPAIRFNIVRCLILLDKPVEAAENLKLALKYGAAPLEEQVYSEALGYEKLLAKQIGEVVVSCDQGGVALVLDGQPLATCPAKEARRVAPGRHQVVGTKHGFVPRTIDVVVVGGETQQVPVSVVPLEKAARIEHRWASWKPWLVFGGGLTLSAIGGLVELQAVTNMNAYDRAVNDNCSTSCAPDDPRLPKSSKSNAELEDKLGISVISIGAAAAVVGGVMLYMNRARTVYPSERTQLGVVPAAGGGVLVLGGRF